MYATQREAFAVRDRALNSATDSTPTSPPSRHLSVPDVAELCRVKRQVVSNLPAKCFHCGADYPPNSEGKGTFVERSDGTVMAYCKTKGACGKSHVLFAGVALVIPHYKQVCTFVRRSAAEATEAAAEQAEHVVPPPTAELIEELQQLQQEAAPQPYRGASGMTSEELREMHDPTCAACGERWQAHPKDCDVNGWRIAEQERVPYPADWPRFDERTGTWTM